MEMQSGHSEEDLVSFGWTMSVAWAPRTLSQNAHITGCRKNGDFTTVTTQKMLVFAASDLTCRQDDVIDQGGKKKRTSIMMTSQK